MAFTHIFGLSIVLSFFLIVQDSFLKNHFLFFKENFPSHFLGVDLLATNSSFSSSENVFIFPLFLKDTFAFYRIWMDSSLLSALEKCFSTSFWPSWFLMRNSLSSELFLLYSKDVTFLLLLSGYFPRSLISRSFIVLSPGLDFCGYILFGVPSKSWTWRFTSSVKFGKFSALLLWVFLTTPFFFFSFWILRIQILDLLLVFAWPWISVNIF